METKTLIQAQANVVRITALRKGDIVKLVQKDYSNYEVFYAVVLDLLNSGNDCFVQFLKYKKTYGGFTAEIKTYSGKEDLSLFPATLEEVKDHFQEVVNSLEIDLQESAKALNEKKEALEKVKEFVSGESQRKLQSSVFREMPQVEYDKKIEESKKEIDI